MPSWSELNDKIRILNKPTQVNFLSQELQKYLKKISQRRGGTNVILYATAFIQKPYLLPHYTSITREDINGFMTNLYKMDCKKGLTLILHVPGGLPDAAETIMEYLHQKFPYIEVIVPAYAMSAGTMMCLGCDRIIMGRQSQLGPIDPQMMVQNRFVSAESIVQEFERAKTEIKEDKEVLNVWYPILQGISPALLEEARKAIDYSKNLVRDWLLKRDLIRKGNKRKVAKEVATFFSSSKIHFVHSRRIGMDKIIQKFKDKLNINSLEDDNELQDVVLTVYHIITMLFGLSHATKVIENNNNQRWIVGGPAFISKSQIETKRTEPFTA